MSIARLSSAELYYELEGDGPSTARVLVIPGTDSSLDREPRPFGWPGSERFSLLSYEHRDLGRSHALHAGQPTMADFAADALELADHVAWPSFSVVGISFGGMVAQELALRAPERVERLVLAVTSGGGSLGSSYPLHELYPKPLAERASSMAELLDTRAAGDASLAAALEAYVTASSPDGPPPEGLCRQLEARRLHDVSARLGALRMPCLVVAGRHDGLAPPERAASLAAAIPGARLAIFDGGHGVLIQDRAAWPLIAAFLACEL